MISPNQLMNAIRIIKEECQSHDECADCPLRFWGEDSTCALGCYTPKEIPLLPEPRILSYQIMKDE